MMKGLKAVGLGLALVWSGVAGAATFDFSLTGGYAASWQIDTATPPFSSDDNGFTYAGVQGAFPGASASGVDIDFLGESDGGGLRLTDAAEGTIFSWVRGSQLFSGDANAPIFRTGSFLLTGTDGIAATMVITDVSVAAVPEPASWAMMIAGFAITGAAMRRRRHRAVKAALAA